MKPSLSVPRLALPFVYHQTPTHTTTKAGGKKFEIREIGKPAATTDLDMPSSPPDTVKPVVHPVRGHVRVVLARARGVEEVPALVRAGRAGKGLEGRGL